MTRARTTARGGKGFRRNAPVKTQSVIRRSRVSRDFARTCPLRCTARVWPYPQWQRLSVRCRSHKNGPTAQNRFEVSSSPSCMCPRMRPSTTWMLRTTFVKVRCDILSRMCGEHVVDQKLFDDLWKRQIHNPAAFWGPFPLPSVALDDPRFVRPIPRNTWGGPSQALTALRVIRWFNHYARAAELHDGQMVRSVATRHDIPAADGPAQR